MPIELNETERYQIYNIPELSDLLIRMMALVNELEQRVEALEAE
jgi:hypothetical protein